MPTTQEHLWQPQHFANQGTYTAQHHADNKKIVLVSNIFLPIGKHNSIGMDAQGQKGKTVKYNPEVP